MQRRVTKRMEGMDPMRQGNNPQDAYIEKPRPNLYNVIKKLREAMPAVARLVYIAKLNEAEKKDYEKEINTFFKGNDDQQQQE